MTDEIFAGNQLQLSATLFPKFNRELGNDDGDGYENVS